MLRKACLLCNRQEAKIQDATPVFSDGSSYKEAVANVEVIIQEWVETARELGRAIPEPKGRLVFA
jgi:predicted RNase H-like HicB family nuclease